MSGKGNILVPVDFSAHTMASCHYALSLAISLNLDVLLFHSFFDQIYFSDGGFATGFETGIMMTDELILDFYKQKETRIREIAEELRNLAAKSGKEEISVKFQMESGDPEVQIMHAIERINPRLIVMGSSGMGKKRIFSGSVARRVIDHAEIPVIAVPDAELPALIKDVVYMTNFESYDSQALVEIDTLLSPLSIHIHCVHVCRFKDQDAAKQLMDSLSRKDIPVRPKTKLSFHTVAGDDYESSLTDYLDQNGISLIAFIPHKRYLFKDLLRQNITKDDLFLTRIPILAIPSR